MKILIPMLSFLLVFTAVGAQIPVETTTQPVSNRKAWVEEVMVYNSRIVNTKHLEFSPTYYENGIVFVTSRADKAKVDENINEPFFELYYAELNPAGIPIHPEAFSARINTRLHEGPVAFTNDYKRIYFTRNNIKGGDVQKGKNGVIRMKIFEGKKGSGDWEDIRELSFNSDNYSCIHPTLSPDNQRLYFSSNMPGGFGGYDLYVAERVGDRWGTPVNLGPEINTNVNEAFPFMHQSGTLFFASQGHGSAGGYDVFLINLKENPQPPHKVRNLGPPFNTGADDLGFSLHRDGKRGFFASSRDGGLGKDDIYRFEAPNGIPGVTQPIEVDALFVVYDESTGERIEGAEIRMFTKGKDGLIIEPDYYEAEYTPDEDNDAMLSLALVRRDPAKMRPADLTTGTNGEVRRTLREGKRYLFVTTADGYEVEETEYSTIGQEEEVTIRIGLQPLPKIVEPPVVVIEPPVRRGSVIVLDKIFYDFNKSAIRAGASRDLDRIVDLMRTYPDMTVELSAHTDCRGSDAYNNDLSEARAVSAERYLAARGISADRITTVGYGESRPRYICEPCTSCSEEEHQYNRRTEIKILTVGDAVDVEYYNNPPDKIDRAPRSVRKR